MKTLQTLSVPSALLATGLLITSNAFGAEICSVILCADGCYTTVSKAEDIPESANNTSEANSCPDNDIQTATNGEFAGFKVPLSKAPAPVVLDCAPSGNGLICEGWPQGESITYSWSASGGIVPDSSLGSANPVRGFSCTSGAQGTIKFTAYSPTGASNALTQTITCPSTP